MTKASRGSYLRGIKPCTVALLFIICGWSSTANTEIEQDKQITLYFQNAPISTILQALADYQDLNLLIADSVSGSYSLRLESVSWQQALKTILQLSHLEIELDGNIMLVMTQQEIAERRQRKRQEEKEALTTEPLGTLNYNVQHTEAAALAKLLRGADTPLSERGRVLIDSRLNTLVIRDVGEVLANLQGILEHLDRPVAQVQLVAYIVTMSDESLRELGIQWGLNRDLPIEGGAKSASFNVDLGVSEPTVNVGVQLARLNGRILNLELSALELENRAEIVASPRLLTSDRHTASIKQGTEIPYEVSSGSNGATSIEFKDAVLGLEVTPQVLSGGRIDLALQISQNTTGRAMKRSNGGEILAIDKQEIKTQVVVKNGETLVLGGVFQHNNAISVSKVPLLSRLPLIGYLFRNESKQNSKRELVIFITPTVVSR